MPSQHSGSKVHPLLPTLHADDSTTIERKSSLNVSSLDTPHLRVLLLQLVMTIVAIVLYSFTDEKFIACVIVVSVSVTAKLCLYVFLPRHPDRHVLILSSLVFSTLYVIIFLFFPKINLTPFAAGSTSSCSERSKRSTLASE